jgi:hypothetical protein
LLSIQLEKLVDRIGKESCKWMNYRLKDKVDNSRKLLYFLRIGLADGLHAVAALRLLFKKGLFVQLPTRSSCPRLQLESDGIKLLIESIGDKVDEKNSDPSCDEETKRQEQTGARGKYSDPHEQTKSLSDLESEMIQNIVQTISGENKPTITQHLHRSIRKCIQTYIADASLLLCFSKWDSAITDTIPQRENANKIADANAVKIADADADKIADDNADADVDAEDADAEDVNASADAHADTTPEQSDRAVGNCNIEETLKKLLSKHITRRNRAFTIERHNGKDTVVVARPSWKGPNSFVREADRSKWVDKLLPDATYVNCMCMYLAAKHSKNYKKVAELYSLKVQKRVPTTKTLAIVSEVCLGDRQLQKLRQYLKLEGVLLELSPKVIDKIDQEVGIRTETDPIFGEYEHYYRRVMELPFLRFRPLITVRQAMKGASQFSLVATMETDTSDSMRRFI